jgi:hypothetical protein
VSRRALVGFGGNAGLIWLRLLKPGFRHCFAALETSAPPGEQRWILYEPLSHFTRLETITLPSQASLADLFRGQGLTVVETMRRDPARRSAPWRPYSCVEAVKRVLGLQASWVFTPWQLYRYLRKYEYFSIEGLFSVDARPDTA